MLHSAQKKKINIFLKKKVRLDCLWMWWIRVVERHCWHNHSMKKKCASKSLCLVGLIISSIQHKFNVKGFFLLFFPSYLEARQWQWGCKKKRREKRRHDDSKRGQIFLIFLNFYSFLLLIFSYLQYTLLVKLVKNFHIITF